MAYALQILPWIGRISSGRTLVADPKKDEAPAAASGAPDAGAGGPSKLMTGILALNMVMMLAVAVVLYLSLIHI